MKVIYENQVKAAGECVEEFKDAGMFIIFGENAPDEIKDYCYSVSVNPINGEIAPGQYVVIDGAEFKITCVGYEAPITAQLKPSFPAPSMSRLSPCLKSRSEQRSRSSRNNYRKLFSKNRK